MFFSSKTALISTVSNTKPKLNRNDHFKNDIALKTHNAFCVGTILVLKT